MVPEPEAGIRSIGATIRAARQARGLTQQRAAAAAKVSRAQLALLEQGGNVSVKFLLKIAKFLELTDLPLDGTVRLTSGVREGLNIGELVESLDLLSAVVDHLRGFAMTAILPPSERAKLQDTPALRDFVAKHLANDAGVQRMAQAIAQLSEDVPIGASRPSVGPEQEDEAKHPRRARRRAE